MRIGIPILTGLAVLVAACKFVPTVKQGEGGETAADPTAQVAAIWDAKVIPYLTARAGTLADVTAAAAKDADAAGKHYGYRENPGSPWTAVVKVEGRIVDFNTKSKAATLDVDVNGDSKADARIQIGPVIKGTALRDSLDFVSFNQFTNQIDFAQFGKAFNLYIDKTLLTKLPREALNGKTVTALGAYPLVGGSDLPLVTPARIEIE